MLKTFNIITGDSIEDSILVAKALVHYFLEKDAENDILTFEHINSNKALSTMYQSTPKVEPVLLDLKAETYDGLLRMINIADKTTAGHIVALIPSELCEGIQKYGQYLDDWISSKSAPPIDFNILWALGDIGDDLSWLKRLICSLKRPIIYPILLPEPDLKSMQTSFFENKFNNDIDLSKIITDDRELLQFPEKHDIPNIIPTTINFKKQKSRLSS